MGFFSTLFEWTSDDGKTTSKSRQSEDTTINTVDRYTKAGEGKHVHESYSSDKTTGVFKEYHGGENSTERSYNKK